MKFLFIFLTVWMIPKGTPSDTTSHSSDFEGKGTITMLQSPMQGWEFDVACGKCPKGSYVEWDMAFTAGPKAPELYVTEYMDGGKWVVADTVVCTRTAKSTKETTTVVSTLRLSHKIKGAVKLRIRAVSPGEGTFHFVKSDNVAARVAVLGNVPPKDSIKLLCIGNSFTYVSNASWMLKALAWSQGHYIDMHDALKGGQTFGQHLALSVTDYEISRGGYDYAFLQNQSQTNAWYAQKKDPQLMDDCKALAAKVRAASSEVSLILESTWSYPGRECGGFGTLEEFDRLLDEGTAAMAREVGGTVSYIGQAFARCRSQYPEIDLYAADRKHQSEYGSYLKACVNYRLLFGEPLPENAPSLGLDPKKTAALARVAAQ